MDNLWRGQGGGEGTPAADRLSGVPPRCFLSRGACPALRDIPLQQCGTVRLYSAVGGIPLQCIKGGTRHVTTVQ